MASLIDYSGLLGVAIGGGLTFASTSLLERARWKRERAARWDASTLAALSEYSSAVKAETRACLRLASSHTSSISTAPLSLSEGLPVLRAAEDERAYKFEPILLLCDRATIDAARQWHTDVWRLQPFVVEPDEFDEKGFHAAFAQASKSRDAFHRAARAGLSVREGDGSYSLSAGPY